ncbi:Acetyltransferase (GNAT) family protein [Amphibacillus marinus]|uniref:Acetyltransferase (GNAT) family protein n=1 Tax=Amphibacillus marinus TaxID=872970 RepID=A0A1H8Q646_9BACI|nr:GNAT family N-acetyltransferase [Amphibacillus marinus]SEO49441.1 Acetyltransferase (GNAT) family protein [Amphibacillus marinus]
MEIRQLTEQDLPKYQAMQTGIADDYIIAVYKRLVTPPENALYGMFINNQLITVAGYTIFPGGNAMLGRLRSDLRFQGRGYATLLLKQIIEELSGIPTVKWLGGYTNMANKAAQRVLNKLAFSPVKSYYSLPLINRTAAGNRPGQPWDEITALPVKRDILANLANDALDIYHYECYYPFPYSHSLISDHKLGATRVFSNTANNRWLFISNDFKGESYAHIHYFWDDHFTQAGLFETIDLYLREEHEQQTPWFDFTINGFKEIPNQHAFDLLDGWILYGYSLNNMIKN